MRSVRRGALRLRNLFRRDRLERELADELDAHVQMHTDDNVRAGMAPDEARRRAILALGGIEQTKERYREQRAVPLLEMFIQDLGFGVRMLRKSPAFTAGAVGALTIGVSASVIVFGIANTLILRPLPAADPHQLVRAYTDGYSNTFYREYLQYRDQNQTLSGLAAFQGVPLVLRTDGPVEHVPAAVVSGNYFATLGVSMALGRPIVPVDDRPGASGVVVLSHRYWERRFAADANVLGRAVTVNGHPFTVIGIAPSAFTGTQSPVIVDAWVPWNAPTLAPTVEHLATGGGRPAHLIGRLRSGVTLTEAQADLTRVAASVESGSGSGRPRTLVLYPARTLLPQVSRVVGTFVSLLTAVAALVLLVACINIANLLLARAEARKREIAVRLALGAGRTRVMSQVLTESLLLSSMAAVAASAIAVLVWRMVARISLPVAEPIALNLGFDSPVIVFTLGLSLVVTILFGLAPAFQAAKIDVLPGLRDGPTATGGRRRTLMRGVLITAQVALSTLLLVSAGVLVRSMTSARAIDLGFSTGRILAASIDLSTLAYTRERGTEFFDRLRARLDEDPRVAHASLAGTLPLTVSSQAWGVVKDGVAPPQPGERVPPVFFDSVSPGYLRTVDIPLLAGRDFDARDHASAPLVAIVNETLAHRFWPGESPIGQYLRGLGPGNSPGAAIEIVGLARNARYATVGEDPKMFMYLPLSQQYAPRVTLLVKTLGDPMAALPLIRAAIQELDPDIAVFRVGTLDHATRVSLLPLHVAATSAGVLGAIALALAAIGIYGLTSYLVRQRTREVGIRLALGAQPSQIVGALTREGLRWTIAGLALGLTAAFAATHLLRGLLYGVSATDPVAFIAIPALLSVTAYAACRAPAGAASRVDPLLALREE